VCFQNLRKPPLKKACRLIAVLTRSQLQVL
jgi:hypothetical protein